MVRSRKAIFHTMHWKVTDIIPTKMPSSIEGFQPYSTLFNPIQPYSTLIMNIALFITVFSMLMPGHKTDLADSGFNKNIVIRLIEHVDSTQRTLTLTCGTEEKYMCSNYSIAFSHTVINGKISLNFTDIIKPATCMRAIGPATATINLGALNNMNYEIEINIGGSKIIGQLAVSNNSYHVTIPDQSKVKFVNPDLYRVPDNTIYGTVNYHSGTTSAIAQKFLDSLKHYGATTALFIPGDYGSFQIEDNGQIKQTLNTAYYFTQNYIYNYNNSSESLKNLVKHFGVQYPDLIQIRLYTTRGETFYSWVQ